MARSRVPPSRKAADTRRAASPPVLQAWNNPHVQALQRLQAAALQRFPPKAGPVQRRATFVGHDDELPTQLREAFKAKAERLRTIVPEKHIPVLQDMLESTGGTEDPVYQAFRRLKYSNQDYGVFDLDDDHQLIALYYEIRKQMPGQTPKEASGLESEVEDSRAEDKQRRQDLNKMEQKSPVWFRTYETALLGAGASMAYYINANRRQIDPHQTIIIGTPQPWGGQRGPGHVNHPASMISPDRSSAGPGDEALMGRQDFSNEIEKTIEETGAVRLKAKVATVAKVRVKDGQEAPDGPDVYYKITLQSGTAYYAKNVVAALGAGPHKEVENKDDINKQFEQEHREQASGKKFVKRALNLDEFQNSVDDIKANMEFGSEVTVFVSGGNAAIDAVTRIVRENAANDGKTIRLVWAQGSSGAAYLTGTDNELSRNEYANHLATKDSAFQQRTERQIEKNGQKVTVTRSDNSAKFDADYYVHGQGQDASKIVDLFDKASVRDELAPLEDVNRELGERPDVGVLGLGARDQASGTAIKLLGPTANALINASAPKETGNKDEDEKAKLAFKNRQDRASETSRILPQNVVHNKTPNDQLTPSRVASEVDASYTPPYVTKAMNAASDTRTTIAIHIAAKYPFIPPDRLEYWANRIVTARRDNHGQANLVGPIPSPLGVPRETIGSYTRAFESILAAENEKARPAKQKD